MPEPSINAMKLAHATQFLDRAQYLLCSYAVHNVIGAAAPFPANHESRKALAARVLSDPGNMAAKLAVSMVEDATLRLTYVVGPPEDSSATDAEMFAVINALWDSWLGVV